MPGCDIIWLWSPRNIFCIKSSISASKGDGDGGGGGDADADADADADEAVLGKRTRRIGVCAGI